MDSKLHRKIEHDRLFYVLSINNVLSSVLVTTLCLSESPAWQLFAICHLKTAGIQRFSCSIECSTRN